MYPDSYQTIEAQMQAFMRHELSNSEEQSLQGDTGSHLA
jgi:hypothetical protein